MKVIYFDGVCGLCNGFIDFIMRIDKKQKFHFSPLQSQHAQTHLPPEYTQDLKTVVYQDGENISVKSDAVLKVLKEVGGVWMLANAARIFPRGFRDSAYEMVAENRYKLFGKKETCRIPSPQERSRFVI